MSQKIPLLFFYINSYFVLFYVRTRYFAHINITGDMILSFGNTLTTLKMALGTFRD
jgi:hypothetical protein